MVSFGTSPSREMLAQAVINVVCEEVGVSPAPTLVLNGRLGRTLGRANSLNKTIEINPLILETSALEDTLRHEVAHFLAWKRGNTSGHDSVWKQAAIDCGARPIAIQKFNRVDLKANAHRYMYECEHGGCKWYAIRAKRSLERPFITCAKHHSKIIRYPI